MKVLIDTCVWSAVLRRKIPDLELSIWLEELIADGRASLIGPIRQELLSGINDAKQFHRLQGRLATFEDIPLKTEHYVKAAEFANICRKRGIQGSSIDFLICSVAYRENLAIFTTDKDFENFKKHLPIRIYQ
ncbi:MAG: PIN domain-containing protein [Pirellulales bacterium]|nr:PIN domain-containing protein [Pirellulales bacterium]